MLLWNHHARYSIIQYPASRIRRLLQCQIGSQRSLVFYATGAAMGLLTLSVWVEWSIRQTSGSLGFPAREGWAPNLSWPPCEKGLTESGFPGDIPVNAITWKVITTLEESSLYFKVLWAIWELNPAVSIFHGSLLLNQPNSLMWSKRSPRRLSLLDPIQIL